MRWLVRSACEYSGLCGGKIGRWRAKAVEMNNSTATDEDRQSVKVACERLGIKMP